MLVGRKSLEYLTMIDQMYLWLDTSKSVKTTYVWNGGTEVPFRK